MYRNAEAIPFLWFVLENPLLSPQQPHSAQVTIFLNFISSIQCPLPTYPIFTAPTLGNRIVGSRDGHS
jgi:hypothetical protein